MNLKYSIVYVFLFISISSFAQKKIKSAQIEGTKLSISAEAEAISRVTFKISSTIEDKSVDEKYKTIFPHEMKIFPLNQSVFKANMINAFKEIHELENKKTTTDDLIEQIFADELTDFFSEDSSNTAVKKKFQAEKKINERINSVYNYFDAQLILLFKYDLEPVSGVLHYNNKPITVQFFQSSNSELFFYNQKHNYYKLIKKIVKKKNLSNIDSVKISISNFFKGEKSSEFNSKYAEEPMRFIKDFDFIIKHFNNYNKNTRIKLIYDRILGLRNEVVLDEIIQAVDAYDIQAKLKKDVKEYFDYKDLARRIGDLQFKKADLELDLNVLKYNELDNYKREIDSIFFRSSAILNRFYDDFFRNKEGLSYDYTSTVNQKSRLYQDYLFKNDDVAYNEDIYSKSNNYLLLSRIRDGKLLDKSNTDTLLVKKKIEQLDDTLSLKEDLLFALEPSFDNLTKSSSLKKYLDSKNDFLDRQTAMGRVEDSLKQITRLISSKLNFAPLWIFKPSKIQLDFNDGFIDHLIMEGEVIGITSTNSDQQKLTDRLLRIFEGNEEILGEISVKGKQLKFVNQFPYGFSSSKDFDDFKEYRLFVYKGRHKQFEVTLEEIFPNYVQSLQNDRLDFSPKDQVVTIYPDDKNSSSIELKKEKSSKLFSLSVYSDFIGLKSGDPNGVLQFEFNKLIPLYTKRKTTFNMERLSRGFNYGFSNYINPQVRWSQLSSNNDQESLTLSYLPIFEGVSTNSIKYVTQLDLLRHETVSIGADLNALSLDFPTTKLRAELNISGRYGITKVLDTEGAGVINDDSTSNVIKTNETNTWRFYPEFILRLRPEERYGANLSFRPIRFNSVTKGFSNISSEESFSKNLIDDGQWLHQIEINAHFSPSGKKDDRFFFRYRYTNNAKWEYNGFSELQVGYTMALKF